MFTKKKKNQKEKTVGERVACNQLNSCLCFFYNSFIHFVPSCHCVTLAKLTCLWISFPHSLGWGNTC